MLGEILDFILKWSSEIPIELLISLMIAIMGFLIRKINGMEKSFMSEVQGIREQQAQLRKDHHESTSELKAAISKLSIDFSNELQKQQEDLRKSYLLALRTAIVNASFPEHYRLEKYDEYHELGGNTFIDDYVQRVMLNKSDD